MFKVFGLTHWMLMIIGIALSCVLVILLRNIQKEKKQKLVLSILVAFSCLFAVLNFVGRIASIKKLNIFENLPISTMDVFAYLSIYILLSKKASWHKFAYLILAPMALLGLIIPANVYTQMPMISLSILSYTAQCASLIAFGVLTLIYTNGYLDNRDVFNSLITLIVTVSIAHIVNVFIRFAGWGVNADYFGTMAENYNIVYSSIASVISVPFISYLPIFAILLGIAFLVKLPFDILKTNREKREQMDELVAMGNMKAQQKYREEMRNSNIQKNKVQSQILVRSQTVATPNTPKSVNNQGVSKSGFVDTKKDVGNKN